MKFFGHATLFRVAQAAAFAAVAAIVVPGAVSAEGPAVRIRGEVVRLDGDMLQVKDRQGASHTVKLAANYRVLELRKADLKEIGNGTYIGVTAVPAKEGTLRAVAIHLFPPAAKGTAEGHRPWDLMPEATMTNAAVDGEKTVIVTPETTIVAMGAGKPDQLVPGAKIMIFGAAKGADGTLTTQSVVVGKDGLAPPM